MNSTPLHDDAHVRQILQERARALAGQQQADTAALGEELVVFRLGEERYCVAVRWIREVQPLGSYTSLPSTPAFVLGLVNVRGRLLAALDLRPLLELAQTPPQLNACLLIINVNGVELGLLADGVVEVRRSDGDLSPALSAAVGKGVPWLRGIDRQLSLALDPPLLLVDPRLAVNTSVSSS